MAEVKTDIIKDYAGEGLIIRRTQELSNILERNKQEFNETGNLPDLSFGRKVASVPMVVLEQWMAEGIDYRKAGSDPETAKRLKRKLNSPEFRAFRTHNSKV